jgi:hypothetical protein
MKKIFITEHQFNTLLNEELGIAKNVIAISDNIEKIVFPFLDSDEMKHSEQILDDLKLVLSKHYFNDMDDFSDLYYKNPEPFKNGYSKNDKTIYLPFITIDGILSVDNIENTIQHEVEHYWQCKNKKTPLSTNHYQELVSLIDNNNPYISTIAEIIFLSKKFEMDAEINGAFAELKTKTNIKTINDVLKNTELGKLYENLKSKKTAINSWNYDSYIVKYSLNIINLNKQVRGERKKPITKDYLNKLLDKTIEYFIYKIGRMLSLHIQLTNKNNFKNIQKNLHN